MKSAFSLAIALACVAALLLSGCAGETVTPTDTPVSPTTIFTETVPTEPQPKIYFSVPVLNLEEA